jgi:hypothetical protein
MATNVFLVFWRGYDAVQLRHLEKWYMLFAYGLPGLMPIIYLTLDHSRRMHIIGPATVSERSSLSANSELIDNTAMVLGGARILPLAPTLLLWASMVCVSCSLIITQNTDVSQDGCRHHFRNLRRHWHQDHQEGRALAKLRERITAEISKSRDHC